MRFRKGLDARRIKDVAWEDMRIKVNGDNAVVTAVSTIVTGTGPDAKSTRYRYADVYARRDGQWRAIASHVVKL